MLFFIPDGEPDEVYKTKNVVLANLDTMKVVKGFTKYMNEIVYKRLKRIYPCSNSKFSDGESIILSTKEVLYKFGEKFFSFEDYSFKEVNLGKVVSISLVPTKKKYHYKVYKMAFYDVLTQEASTKYVVIPT